MSEGERANVILEAVSVRGKRIRLTTTIWEKVRHGHPELASRDYLADIRMAVESPAFLVKGWTTELLSLWWCETAPRAPKHLCVVYRELNGDGFIITAFFVSQYERLLRREVLWRAS